MKRTSILVCLLLVVSLPLLADENVDVRMVEGVAVDAEGNVLSPDDPRAREAARLAKQDLVTHDSSGLINFDDVSPCGFSQTVPVGKTQFKLYGVKVKHSNLTDGPAILDECGSFGVSGHSSPNFLAFNCGASMENGGTPFGPTTFLFTPARDVVSLRIGAGFSNVGKLVRVQARTKKNKLVDEEIVVLNSVLQTVTLVGTKKIKKLVVDVPSGNDTCVYVIDNLSY